MTQQNYTRWQNWGINWTICFLMMIRQMSFLGLVRQYLLGDGVMTCAMAPVPCISVVRIDLFQITVFESRVLAFIPWATLTLSQHLKRPIFRRLIVLFVTCLPCFFFLSGLALGGVWGVREGARRPLAVSNTRLRINSVLNSVTRRGTFIGNSAGVMGKFASM